MFSARQSSPSSSSPPSSPTFPDSSPLSSPGFGPIDNDAPPSPVGLAHPFAASAKANRYLPSYEKKRSDPPLLVLGTPSKRPRYSESCHSLDVSIPSLDLESLPATSQCTSPIKTPAQIEAEIWDKASNDVIDNVNGNVQLGDMSLTHIPSCFIDDLKKFYAPPACSEIITSGQLTSLPHSQVPPGGRLFSRIATAPAGQGALISRAPADRASTTSGVTLGLPREEIHLLLQMNQITHIPVRLMDLQRLTILSLRSNSLTSIPPEIVHLSNLHTLNLAMNKLQYLPSEMLTMSLSSLSLNSNPFLEAPSTVSSRTLRPVSDTVRLISGVIPLTEICLRRLFSPLDGFLHPQSSLQQYIQRLRQESLLCRLYELPLPEDSMPPHICHALNSYAEMKKHNAADSEPVGIGICPSPRHMNLWCLGSTHNHNLGNDSRVDAHPLGSSVFTKHVEERFTWENHIAGQPVRMVPVKWRGCSSGCLDFLSPDYDPESEYEGDEEPDDADEEEEVALQCGAVRMLDFGSPSGFGDDEFGDE